VQDGLPLFGLYLRVASGDMRVNRARVVVAAAAAAAVGLVVSIGGERMATAATCPASGCGGVVQQHAWQPTFASGVSVEARRRDASFHLRAPPFRPPAAARLAAFPELTSTPASPPHSLGTRSHGRAPRTAGRLHLHPTRGLERLHHRHHPQHHRLPGLDHLRHRGC
jgi:hypothetical protein